MAGEPPVHPAILNIEACPEPVSLGVKGSLPPWLAGSLYRVGPGTFDIRTKNGGVFTVGHWFDGISVMHRFQIDGGVGTVRYQSRCIAEEQKRKMETDGGSYLITFGTDPCYGLFGRAFFAVKTLMGGERPEYNIGVDVKEIAAPEGGGKTRLIATSDQHIVLEFDPETLEPTGQKKFAYSALENLGEAKGMFSSTHGQRDEKAKEYYNYVLFTEGPPKYHIFCIPDDKPAYVLTSFAASPAYIHSFGLTEHYFILLVWPSTMTTLPPKILYTMNVLDTLNWEPELGVQIYVVDRQKRALVGRYQTEAFYCFHTVNSFEVEDSDGGRTVCVDLITYKDRSIIDHFKVDKLRATKTFPSSRYSRVTMKNVPVDGAAFEGTPAPAEVAELCPGVGAQVAAVEFGSVHPDLHMRRHRYVYVSGSSPTCSTGLFDAIGKIDIESGQLLRWSEAGCAPGEPIFFPKPGASEEDEGVLLTMVHGGQAKSFLLLLDAKDLSELARAETPDAFPLGFHGKFVSSKI